MSYPSWSFGVYCVYLNAIYILRNSHYASHREVNVSANLNLKAILNHNTAKPLNKGQLRDY